MYHFLYIFTLLTLCTLPTFGATNSGSKNNEFSFSIKGKFTGDTNYSPGTGPRAKIISPSTCNFDLYKGQTSFNLTTEFDSSITCPAGTNSITLEFTPDNSTAGISPKHKIQNPTHTINLTKTKKNYKLPDIVLVQTNKTASATQTSSVQKIGNDQSGQEQSRLERTGFQKFCEDEGYKDETGNSSLGEIDATCNKHSNDSQIYFYCYKYKNSPIPEYEIRKHFAYYCFTNKTTPVNPQQKQRPNSHKKPKTCPKITPAWKNQNNAVSGACDTETGELYITECKRDYVGAKRGSGIGKEGYKSCTPSNLTKIGEKCDAENAISAKYAQVNGAVVCQPTKCKCGYDLENNKCIQWPTDKQCSTNDKNAKRAAYECKEDKAVCVIQECNTETHFLDTAKNKCIAKSTVKCADNEQVNNNGKCEKNASATPKKSTASMADVCEKSAGRLDCANLTITCTNGFNDGWDEQKALDAMCPNEVKSEQARREKLKNDAESRFCKSGMKFEADCSANKVVFGCSEYSRRAPNEIERNLQNYCSTTKTNTVEIQDETTQKRADKEANEEKLKKICEESGTKGKWNKTLDKCNCNEKNHIFDKETGCGETTTAFKNNKEHLDNLNAGLEKILQELADGQQK